MSSLAERADGTALVRAAGAVVWRTGDGGALETAVVHRPKYDDWSLPKGKPEAGEHLVETAAREVAEETGLRIVLGRRSVRTSYDVAAPDGGRAPKEVDYWTGQWVGGDFRPNDEVDELRWLPVEAAGALCSYAHDRAVLSDLLRTDVPRMPALVLVRHGRAGDRREWDGPDELRPLDDRGWAQARRLAAVLPLFGPASVLSAERLRCRQTVTPLAEALGLPVESLPEVGEEEFRDDPEAGLDVVTRLLAPRPDPGVAIVCSQGGAIPTALMALGVRPEGSRLFPPSAKGSVWVLGGRAGALAADYYRDFGPDPAPSDDR
ncbi:MAG TPA: NUDIX hydrolase [Blastococcus sp.]|nr:NUDIX hydrolase [Blastococcus sp.]